MAMRIPNTKLFIDNKVVDAVSDRKIPTINPVDGIVIAQISEGDKISQDLGAQSLSRQQQVNKELSEEGKILKNGKVFNAEEKSRKIEEHLVKEPSSVHDPVKESKAQNQLDVEKNPEQYSNTKVHLNEQQGKKKRSGKQGTETKEAKKFDDLFFEITKDGKKEYRLLQAKHKEDESKKIKFNNLLTESDSDYSLVKYFFSYQDSKKEELFKNGIIKDVTVCTNINLDLGDKYESEGVSKTIKEVTQRIEDSDSILDVDNKILAKEAVRYRFSDDFALFLKPRLESYNLTRLARRLAECCLKNVPIKHHQPHDIFRLYHTVLAQEIIDVKAKKFRDEFINNNNISEDTKKFRKVFAEEIKKQSEEMLTLKDINSAISGKKKIVDNKPVSLNLSKNFGKPKLEDNKLTIAKRLAECFLKNSPIQYHQPHDIFKLYHTVLAKEIIDVKAKKFRDEFINNKNISEDTKKFRKVFAEEIKKQSEEMLTLEDINSAISGERKIVDDKPVSLNLSEHFGKESWPNNAIPDKDIKDFLDHLVFAVNQPNEEQLGRIIESYISEDFNFAAKNYVYNELFVKMLGWLNGKGKEFISYQDGSSFFEEIKQKLSELELTGLTLEYRSRIEKFGIEFSQEGQEAIHEIQMNFQVFNVITQQSTLSAIKVYQVLQNRFQEKYIFMQLDSILHLQYHVIQAFKGSSNLLVIECKKETTEKEENISLYGQLSSIIQSSSNKKVVLITQGNDFLANRFKSALKDKYKEEIDEKNSLTDLTNESQNKLLSEGKVIFQGEEVSLGTLIDDKSKHLVDAEVLSKLINNEKIKIGKTLTTSRYKDVKDYYIDRTFNRYIKIKKDFMEKKSKFFITRDDQVTESNRQQNKDIVLISDIKEDFKKLCHKYKEPIVSIHWLKQEINEFIWQQSHGGLSKLREFVDTNEQSIQEYKPKKITDIPDRVVIIAAEPGMGKSTVLTLLALKTKESDPSLWVVRINLLDQTSRLYKWQKDKTEIDESQAVKFLYGARDFLVFRENGEQTEEKKEQMINNILELIEDNGEVALKNNEERKIKGLNMLEVGLFHNFYEQGKIALLFDGFDKICPVYKDQVIKLLEVLKGTKAKRIWMTTRPYNIQSEPENKLSTFSYALKPFLEEEQRNFLKKFWKKNLELSELDEQRSEVFIDELLPRFSEYINDQERGFVGIPLQISMIAKVFQDTFKEFYDSKSQELSNEHKQKLSEKLNLVTLYKCFIKIKFYEIRFGEKKPAINTDDPDMRMMIKKEYKKFIEDHRKLALFEDNKLGELLSEQERSEVRSLIESIEQGGEKTGIINGKPNFIHRTFAEYFAASYLWEKFKSIQFDKFGKDFIESIIINNLIKDDRIQICKFFQLETQKDLENNVDFSDKEDKLKTLLTTLVDKIYSYGPVKYKNSKQSTKLLLKIIEFSLSAKEGSDLGIIRDVVQGIQDRSGFFEEFGIEFSQDANDRKLALLCVSAEMGYIKLADALISVALEQLRPQFLQDYLKNDNWLYNPVWLAAENGHLDVVQILVKKLSYDTTWEDKYGKNLFQCIFDFRRFDVLRSCLKLDIIDFNHIMYCDTPLDVIDTLLIEKTDIDFFNQFKISRMPAVSYVMRNSINYDTNFIKIFAEKGIDLNAGYDDGTTPINIITSDFKYGSICNVPHYFLGVFILPRQFYYCDKMSPKFFNSVKSLLEYGAIYNLKDERDDALQHVKQTHYIHKLLEAVVNKTADKENNSISNLLDKISDKVLQLMIQSPSTEYRDCKGYKFSVYSNLNKIAFSPSYDVFLLSDVKQDLKDEREEIFFVPEYIQSLLFQTYIKGDTEGKVIKDTLNELSLYIEKFREEIETSNRLEVLKKLEKKGNISTNNSVMSLLERVMRFYIDEYYEIDEAFIEVSKKVLKISKKIQSYIKNLPKIGEHEHQARVYKNDEILNILGIKDSNIEEDLMSKINESNGISLLNKVLLKLNNVGQKNKIKVLKFMFKFSDQSSQTFELLKTIDDLFDAINTNNKESVVGILQDAESKSFIEAAVNVRNKQRQTLLDLACEHYNVEIINLLRRYGAKFGNDYLEVFSGTQVQSCLNYCTFSQENVDAFNADKEMPPTFT